MSERELFDSTAKAVTSLFHWENDLLLDVDNHMASLPNELPTGSNTQEKPKNTTKLMSTDVSDFQIQCAIRVALPTNNLLPSVVNLTTFLKQKKVFNFPPCYNGLQNQSIITTALHLAACQSGFKLTQRKDKPTTYFGLRMRFDCDHSQVYRRSKNHQNQRKTSTKLPLSKEYTCLYGFILRMQATGQLPVSSTKKFRVNGPL
jgi:hypothetical protein